MKGFLIRCAIAGAIIGGAAAATFQTISTYGPSTVGIAPAAAPVAAPVTAPAAAPAVATQSTQATVAAPAATANPGPCAGAFQSLVSHETQLLSHSGPGDFLRENMSSPKDIKAVIDTNCDTMFPGKK